jgi:hypothetical protein
MSRGGKLILLAAFGFSLQTFGADSDYRSDGFINGRSWTEMSISSRIDYISGFYDGLSFLATDEGASRETRRLRAEVTPYGMKIAEIVAVVDGFYADAANARLPVPLALVWAKKKIFGASEQELDRTAASLRRAYAAKETDR